MYEVFHEVDAMRNHSQLPLIDDQSNPTQWYYDLSRTTNIDPGTIITSTIHVALHRASRAISQQIGTREDHRRQLNELIAQIIVARYMLDEQVEVPQVQMAAVPISAL
jgi:hypothetical protein